MKKTTIKFIKRSAFCVGMILMWQACTKDIGNYTYTEINELAISGIDSIYNGLLGQPIKIVPVLSFTVDDGKDTSKYSYQWLSMDDNIAINIGKQRVISTSRNLDTILSLPTSNYTMYYRVTEKSTGIQWAKSFKLNVTTAIRDGWLVLNESEGRARLDMLAYDFTAADGSFHYYHDLLASASSGIVLSGKPLMVYYLYDKDIFTSQYTNRIYVGTDEATYSINNQTYSWDNNRKLNIEVMRPTPANFHAVRILNTGKTGVVYLLDSEGIVSLEYSVLAMMFGPTLNRLAVGGRLNIAPYVAEQYRYISPYLVMYDTDNKRFIVHSGTNASTFIPTSSDVDVFDPSNIGKDLVYFEFSPAVSGHYFAVLKDNTSSHFILRFVMSSTSVFTPLAYDKIEGATDIDKALSFAVDPTEAYLFYHTGSKIYQYDPFKKTTKLMLDLGSRKISLMKYQKLVTYFSNTRYQDYAKKLIVCSYDESSPDASGRMELYNVPSFNGDLSLSASYDGFGKIVDITYRESN